MCVVRRDFLTEVQYGTVQYSILSLLAPLALWRILCPFIDASSHTTQTDREDTATLLCNV